MLDSSNSEAKSMDRWRGHLPVTTTALEAIFAKRLAGAATLTMADRVLYTACEMRCAVAMRNIVQLLGSEDPIGVLRGAATAFATIGAVHFVRDLQRAADEIARAPTPGRRRHCLAVLEDRLLCTDDPIDTLIARYASGCLRDCLRSADPSLFGTLLN